MANKGFVYILIHVSGFKMFLPHQEFKKVSLIVFDGIRRLIFNLFIIFFFVINAFFITSYTVLL